MSRSEPMHPDFHALVRRNLPPLRGSGAAEAEMVEELTQLLEDAWADAAACGARPTGSAEISAWVREQIPRWGELADLVGVASNPDASTSRPVHRRATTVSSPWRRLMTGWWQDLRGAARLMAKSPGFTAVSVVTLALGIGLNSAVFSVVETVLLRPLPVIEPEELVRIYSTMPNGFMPQEPMSYPDFEDVAARDDLFQNTAGFSMTQLALQADDEAQLIIGEMVAGDYFGTLGIEPLIGRTFGATDTRRGQLSPVAVLSHSAWQRRFGGDPGVVGQEILLNGRQITLIGVTPSSFRGLFPAMAPELWLPAHLALDLGTTPMQSSGSSTQGVKLADDRGRRWLWTVSRLRPETPVAVATEAVTAFGQSLAAEYPDTNDTVDFTVLPFLDVKILPGGIDQGVRFASLVLLGMVALVLLISSANLASMLLARASARRREIATRLSLGASRPRLIRQLLTESLLLALVGGGLGLLIAGAAAGVLSTVRPLQVLPLELATEVNWRVVLFTFALSSLAALVFGLAPAFEATRTDLSTTLREEGSSTSGTRRRRSLQSLLVTGQVALSTVLLVCAALSLRSALNAQRVDTGFDPAGVATAQLDPSLQGWDPDRIAPFYDQLRQELTGMPRVETVAYAGHLPLTLYINTWGVAPADRVADYTEDWPEVDAVRIDSEYFRALGIPILQGRSFEPVEIREQRPVVMVNEELASRFWPGESAVGQRVQFSADGDPQEVVGVVADGKYRTLGEEQRAFFYVPMRPATSSRFVMVRMADGDGKGDATAGVAALRRGIRRLDPHLAISSLSSLEQAMSPIFALPRLSAAAFGVFGVLGLLIAAIGLYGVLAYAVSQRTQEIGIRVAIGAEGDDIVRMVLRQGLVLTATGLAVGLAAAFAVTRALGAILYGVGPHDLLTFAAVAVVLLAVAVVACWLPARRAVRIDPLSALRFGSS